MTDIDIDITKQFSFLLKPQNERTREEQSKAEDLAHTILRGAYYTDVREVAEEALQQIESGEITNTDELDTWLHETVDGHERVIYTGQAMDTVRYSDNDEEMVSEFGADGLVKGDSIQWSQIAYHAMLADVREELGEVEFPRVTDKVRKAVHQATRDQLLDWLDPRPFTQQFDEPENRPAWPDQSDDELRALVIEKIENEELEPGEVL